MRKDPDPRILESQDVLWLEEELALGFDPVQYPAFHQSENGDAVAAPDSRNFIDSKKLQGEASFQPDESALLKLLK
jgi:hypothetical protein